MSLLQKETYELRHLEHLRHPVLNTLISRDTLITTLRITFTLSMTHHIHTFHRWRQGIGTSRKSKGIQLLPRMSSTEGGSFDLGNQG